MTQTYNMTNGETKGSEFPHPLNVTDEFGRKRLVVGDKVQDRRAQLTAAYSASAVLGTVN